MGISIRPPQLAAVRTVAPNSPVPPRTTEELLRQIVDPYGVYCVLELRMARGNSIFHVFPVMPEALNVAQRYLQTITPTQGGVFIDEYGAAPSPIVLQGTFGRSPRVGITMGQEALMRNSAALGLTGLESVRTQNILGTDIGQTTEPVTGYRLVKMLGEMVELSHRPHPETGQLPTARFYNFAWGATYEVALSNFSAQMSIQRNGMWAYTLEMTVLRRLNDPLSNGKLNRAGEPVAVARAAQRLHQRRLRDQALGKGFNIAGAIERFTPAKLKGLLNIGNGEGISGAESRNSFASKTRDLLQRTFDTVEKTRRTVSTVTSLVNSVRGLDVVSYASGVLDRTLGLWPGTVAQFVDTVKRWPQIVGSVETAIGSATRRVPAALRREVLVAQDLVETVSSAVTKYLEKHNDQITEAGPVGAALATLGQTPPDLKAAIELAEAALTLGESIEALKTSLAINGLEDVAGTSFTASLESPPEAAGSNSQQYTIRQNDTLAGIASRFYGDENAWPSIAASLGSVFSDVSPTEPLDLYIGKVISVPNAATFAESLIPYVFDLPKGERAFGRDLPDFLQVQKRDDDGTKELVVLSEFNTLLQGIIHRLQTPEGAIPDDPEFGAQLPGLVGQEFGSLNEAMNSAKLEEALNKEPRLQAITNIRTLQQQDTLELEFSATARNAGSLGHINLSLSRQSP